MKINVQKTKSMLIIPPRQASHPLCFDINGETIENVYSFRYLGVIIDDKLTWTEHLDHVCESMNSRAYLISRHKSSISQNWLHIISSGLILTVLDYCLPAWGNLAKTKYSRLDSIVFRVIKMILPNVYHRETNKYKLYEKVNWLTVAERYEFSCLSFLYRNIIQSTSLTKNLTTFFVKIPESDRVTRNKGCFLLPRMQTEFGKTSYYYQAIKVWNCLPYDLKVCSSVSVFENKIRDILIRCRNDDFVCTEEKRIINNMSC
jgi:hypothetical protein